jgi:tetratricopeptide (TPR) repeat protein
MIRLSSSFRRPGRTLAFCCALVLCLGDCHAEAADESADLIGRLRGATELVAAGKLTHRGGFVYDLWEYGVLEPGGLLVEIGLAQLALDDLAGALMTAKALPAQSHCRNCGEACARFLTELAVALVRRGDLPSARNALKSQFDKDDRWIITGALLAIARAQANAGDIAGARQTCDEAVRDIEKSTWLLIDVARTQVRIGDERAPSALQKAGTLIDSLPATSQERAYLSARLAVPIALRGDRQRTMQLLEEAPAALDLNVQDGLQKDRNGYCQRHIAYAYARIGDFANAVRIAATMEDTWRDRTYADIAIAQWNKCDLDGAQRTIQAGPEGDLRDEILGEIARARSLRDDDDKGLTTMRLIKNDSRRAQATLEIAASMARQGKNQEARRLVANINYLRIRGFDADQQRPGEQLKFDVLATWGTSSEHKKGMAYSNLSWRHHLRMRGDLLAAAVRCRVALDGRGSVSSLAKPEYRDVRKAAYAQASEGDAAGALAWVDRLPNGHRIMALVGAASGHAEHLKSAKRRSTDPIPLNPFLEALDDIVDRELIEDH